MNSPALWNSDLVLNLLHQDGELEEHGKESQVSQYQFEIWFGTTFIGLGDRFNGLQKSNGRNGMDFHNPPVQRWTEYFQIFYSTATAGLKKVFTLTCGTLSQVPEILHLNILVKSWDGNVSFDSNSHNYPLPKAKKDLILHLKTRKKLSCSNLAPVQRTEIFQLISKRSSVTSMQTAYKMLSIILRAIHSNKAGLSVSNTAATWTKHQGKQCHS